MPRPTIWTRLGFRPAAALSVGPLAPYDFMAEDTFKIRLSLKMRLRLLLSGRLEARAAHVFRHNKPDLAIMTYGALPPGAR